MEIENTYYGRMDFANMPKESLQNFMIDECINNIITKRLEKFDDEFTKKKESFQKQFPEIKKILTEYKNLSKEVDKLHQIIAKQDNDTKRVSKVKKSDTAKSVG